MDTALALLLWFAVLSTGVMAGVYFTFSAFAMRALDALEHPAGMEAMRSINRVILRSAFMPLFVASTAACAVLAAWGAARWGEPGGWQMANGGALYVLGMFAVTARGNVPLNTALDRAPAAGPEGQEAWRRYMRRWTALNHLRTAASAGSMALLTGALVSL